MDCHRRRFGIPNRCIRRKQSLEHYDIMPLISRANRRQIFAINTVVPMLGTVYWGGDVPPRYQLSMNVATLLGSMIGQVCFGILADIYGRRKMYGLELLVTILASLGFASASTGVYNSMSMVAWLIFWRIVMGIGIGADYPLSAVITAEFSPTKYRGRMIAAVFFCQPLGQMFATLTAYVATVGFRRYITGIPQGDCSIHSLNQKSQDCARTVDQVWRLVAGLGAFPAALAIVSRLTIPESVRSLNAFDPGCVLIINADLLGPGR